MQSRISTMDLSIQLGVRHVQPLCPCSLFLSAAMGVRVWEYVAHYKKNKQKKPLLFSQLFVRRVRAQQNVKGAAALGQNFLGSSTS